jgi:hypothetical protein
MAESDLIFAINSFLSPCSQALEVVFASRLHLGRVDRMQRNFGPMRKQVEAWQQSELTDVTA